MLCAVLIAMGSFVGCKSRVPDEPASVEQRTTTAPSSTATPVSSAPAPAASAEVQWEEVKLLDKLPFCVFSSYDERTKVDFVKDATKQILKADSKVIIGTYVTPCLNGACDRKPSHWCSLDREGDDTFVLHSFLSYEHKPGTTCTEDCKPVIAACETPELKAGKYTIKYQGQAYPLKIPSVLKAPCLKPD